MAQEMKTHTFGTVIVGSGCAGLACADALYDLGVRDAVLVTEGLAMGTSINTGSDKQTYYKLSLSGGEPDSVYDMAKTLYAGGCMEGEHALIEAAYSAKAFYKLVSIGVDFPKNEYGEYVGYRTDHDVRRRATSCGPLTSKFMATKLAERIKERSIPVFEGLRTVKVLVGGKKARGVLCVDDDGNTVLIKSRHVVLATGGESGVYASSVYPKSQTGSLHPALSAGCSAVNLTEWQYGIASTDFRWNLSGTYMQVIPRFLSKGKDGEYREFLSASETHGVYDLIFEKGYNWPFSPAKLAGKNRSSLIDMAVYNERLAGREVYLDYTREPEGFSFGLLGEEAAEYLTKSGCASLSTPIARLRAMNERAYRLYLDNGIDLERDYLKIDVCAQHCNGGLSVDSHYMSREIEELYFCGECSGTFGIARPGGTALNNTQVSAMRAAESIAKKEVSDVLNDTEAFSLCKDTLALLSSLTREGGKKATATELLAFRKEIGVIMSEYCAFVRSAENAETALGLLRALQKVFPERNRCEKPLLKEAMINYDILHSAIAIAASQKHYCESGFGSRGSFLVKNKDGAVVPDTGDHETLFRLFWDGEDAMSFRIVSDRVSPLPDSEQWFETVYNAYYEE